MSEHARIVIPALVDTHVHLFDPQQRRYPWLTDVPTINRPHLLQEYHAAVHGITVDSFVFVEVGAHDEDGLDEARWVASLGVDEPRLGAIVAQARLERGVAVREELDELAQITLVHGVRRILAAPFQNDLAFCLQPAFLEAVRLLRDYGFSFDIGISAVNLPNVVSMVQQCPDVSFILNHIGKPLIAQGVMEPWRTQFRQLAALPNVSCKVSGLLTEAGPEWSLAKIRPYIGEAVDAFGFDRLMFGSDFPVQNLVGDYVSWATVVLDALADATDDERTRLFRTNARRFYRIDRR